MHRISLYISPLFLWIYSYIKIRSKTEPNSANNNKKQNTNLVSTVIETQCDRNRERGTNSEMLELFME